MAFNIARQYRPPAFRNSFNSFGIPTFRSRWIDIFSAPAPRGAVREISPGPQLRSPGTYPVNSRGSVALLGELIGFPESFSFADVNIQPPESPSRFSLRLDVELRAPARTFCLERSRRTHMRGRALCGAVDGPADPPHFWHSPMQRACPRPISLQTAFDAPPRASSSPKHNIAQP
jgi:hypothetical protein